MVKNDPKTVHQAANEWQLYEAKNRLSEVVNRALAVGPQRIRRRGDTVVVLSQQEFDRLGGEKEPSFLEYWMQGPTMEGLDLTRDRSLGREFDF